MSYASRLTPLRRRLAVFIVMDGPPLEPAQLHRLRRSVTTSFAKLFAGTFRHVGADQDHQLQILPMRRLERNLVKHQAPAGRMIEFPRTAFRSPTSCDAQKRANASLAALSESISARVGASFR